MSARRNCVLVRWLVAVGIALVGASARAAAPALRSGPAPGALVLPFTSTLVTGPFRGQQHCYICELKDEPAVLIFARRMDAPTARLLRAARASVRAKEKENLFAWFVFLGESGAAPESALEDAAYQFARANEATGLPVSVLGDAEGPPGYLIARDAVVTVLLFRNRKVVASRAFRAADWNERTADAALEDLPALLATPPAGTGS